jgi:hypothetical protein
MGKLFLCTGKYKGVTLTAKNLRVLVTLGVLVAVPYHAAGEERAETDHSFTLEFGPAGERNLNDRTSNFGGSVGVEVTPIEEWLEIEAGATLLTTGGRREIEGDVLFKKPFRLSSTAEFMVGLGPQASRKLYGEGRGTSIGLEFILDFMFWPTKNLGWYFEPGYGYGIGNSKGERSFGGSVGILFGF